ncbi:hypothetical protein H0H93_013945 [Arthromyces matolae]|nr:hypothetical protein H0H93_013945 [Arthromyces matolae]
MSEPPSVPAQDPILGLETKPAVSSDPVPLVTPETVVVQSKPSLLVTVELQKAIEECKAKVARIVKECRARNRKFRDVEFDIETDEYRCLHGLDFPPTGKYTPSDVQRVTQIFDKPQFFINEADSNDIIQGKIGDCWFLSALTTISTAKGLIEKICVARDEQVGVYGFIFFRDNRWVDVVVDDLLYTTVPKFEQLTIAERELYHEDKDQYNSTARKGGKTLYFARSGAAGETWVPLIEKAFAKLHGDYVSLSGGKSLEAVEDLTGGVSTAISNKDILDVDKFWSEELLKANQDRIFGCSYDSRESRSGIRDVKVDGLIGNHAYSVLRAVEAKGKRFVVLRNPWGRSEWTGRWSDGSKEWTHEWLQILPLLNHEFGDDGQFVMEYSDFLDAWDQIHRTILFDSSWIMSQEWLQVPVRPLPSAWSHGDVVFTFTLPKATRTIVVLSQLDSRYFKDIAGTSSWSLDFTLVKRGESLPAAEASSALSYARSINVEVELDEGEYNVYVRLDRTTFKDPDYFKKGVESGWDHRKLSRILTERAKSRSIASNFKPGIQQKHIPDELKSLLDKDKVLYDKKQEEFARKKEEAEAVDTVTVTTVTTTTTTTRTLKRKDGADSDPGLTQVDSVSSTSPSQLPETIHNILSPIQLPSSPPPIGPPLPLIEHCVVDPGHSGFVGTLYPPASPKFHNYSPIPPPIPAPPPDNAPPPFEIAEDENSAYIGLRVYTQNVTATVGGVLYRSNGLLSPPASRPCSPPPQRAR